MAAACGGDDNDATRTASPFVSQAPTGTPTARPEGLPADRLTFYGADAGDQASSIVSGDFNGDGIADVALGAATAAGPDNDRAGAGEAYVFLGPFAPGNSLDAADGDFDAVFYGAAPDDALARTLVAADFNGDGTDDLAMAAPSAASGAGRLYLMFGGDWPDETDFTEADPDVLLAGADVNDFAGYAMAAANVDADGASDLVIGAMLADGVGNDRPDSGEVYVVPGSSLIAGDTIALGDPAMTVYGALAGDRLGEALTAGDINADGLADLVLAATFHAGPDGTRPGAGLTYVIASPATLPLDLANGGALFSVLGADAGDQLGHSLGAGDTDGDGAADIWLGAVSADGPDNAVDLAGEATLVAGNTAPGSLIDSATGASPTIYGPETEARLGRFLAVANVIGDDHADLIISAPNVDDRAGKVFVFEGDGAYPEDASDADVVLIGLDAGDILGHESFGTPSLAVADVNDDGRADLLLSAPAGDGPDNDRTDCGEAYVLWSASLGGG